MIPEITSYTDRPFKAIELIKLYRHMEWWEERKEGDIQEMLERSVSVGAWIDDELIGFARAISDDTFRAYIEDVMIHKDYQNLGIGTKLISHLVESLSHIDTISLFCEESFLPFYEGNQFKYSKKQVVMHKKGSSKNEST